MATSGATEANDARLRSETVVVIGQGMAGLGPIREEVAAALAQDAEYRVREIVQEAVKFMRHSKRAHLTTGDLDAALRLRNVEPLYGMGVSDPLRFSKVTHVAMPASASVAATSAVVASGGGGGGTTGGSNAGGGSGPGAAATGVAVTAVAPGEFTTEDLYFLVDREVDLAAILKYPLPPPPVAPTVKAHWLAIEGVQPAIAQNPAPEEAQESSGEKRRRREAPDVEVKPPVKHILSKELQLYYEHVVKSIRSSDECRVDLALTNLAQEPGLQQLLPYFTLLVHDEVVNNRRQLGLLKSIMRLVRTLIQNPHFTLEPYLHQLLPPVLTCLVGKRLCEKPSDDHWSLRDYAAEVIADICAQYGTAYASLQTRITKTLISALLDPSKSLPTHYGAIVGMTLLGPHVINALLFPNLPSYIPLLDEEMKRDNLHPIRKLEVAKVYGAIVVAAGRHVRNPITEDIVRSPSAKPEVSKLTDERQSGSIEELVPHLEERYRALAEEFGESLFPSCSRSRQSGLTPMESVL